MNQTKPGFTGEKDDKLGREMWYRQGKHVENPNKEQPNGKTARTDTGPENAKPDGHISGSPNGNDRKEEFKPVTPSLQTIRREFTRKGNPKLVPSSIGGHLNEHQHQAVALGAESLEKYGGFLLADGTGAGKTRSQLGIAKYFADKGKKVLIVSPAEVIKPNWETREAYGSFKHDAKAMDLPVHLNKGDNDLPKSSIHLTTYDNLDKFKDKVDKDTILILDEAHYLKNPSSGRAVHAKDLMDKVGGVMYATATPGDKPLHLGYLVRAHVFGKLGAARTYKKLGLKSTPQGWVVDPKIGHVEVARRIAGLFNQMTKDGLMLKRELTLDNVNFGLDRLELTKEQHAVVDQTYEDWYKRTNGNRAIALMMSRLHQEPFKVPMTVKSALEELKQGRSVLIFAGRINDIEDKNGASISEGTAKALKKSLIEAGVKEELIGELHGGETSSDIRKQSVDDFQNGKKKLLIATIQSGGTGINLDDTTGENPRSVIVVTPPFTANEVVQAIGRVNRLNTKSGARIKGILANTVIDDWNAGILEQKFRTLGAAVAGESAKGSSLIGEDVPNEWRRPFEWSDSLLPEKPFESVKALRKGDKKQKKEKKKKKKGFLKKIFNLLASEYNEGNGKWLLEHKSGLFTDRKGHKYKLIDGKRVPVNPKHSIVVHKGLHKFLSGKAQKISSSSTVRAAKYDSDGKVLRIAYHSQPGIWHKYGNVNSNEAESFWTAPSKGTWIWDNLKIRGTVRDHKKPWSKEDWLSSPSKANIEVLGKKEHRKIVAKALRKMSNGKVEIKDIPSLVGAPNDASVRIRMNWDSENGDAIIIKVDHSDYECERSLYTGTTKDELVMDNELFLIKSAGQGTGLGTKIFAKEVNFCRKNGVGLIVTYAGGLGESYSPTQKLNGYYTWPRLGYNAKLQSLYNTMRLKDKKIANKFKRKWRSDFPNAKRIQDIFKTRKGREWWKKNGISGKLIFDLNSKYDDSKESKRILENYLNELQEKGKI